MELDFKDSAGERKEKTQVFMVQRQKRRGLIPWLVILVLLIAVAALLKTSFAAHARQKEMEEDLARQHELLEKMNTRLREAEEAGLLHRGDRICLVGFGGGLVYAGCVLEW